MNQSLSASPTCDIIIVGAGIVGATLACQLSGKNPELKITLIEAATFKPSYSEAVFDPRVVAITPASQQLLNEIGVWTDIVARRACPYTKMDVWDGRGTGSIHFDCREAGETVLGYIVENSIIQECLLKKLHGSSVVLLAPAAVSAINLPSPGELSLIILEDGSSIRAPLIIATDGALSPVRQMAHLETREWDYGHTAIITTAETELPHGFSARQCFTDHGPLAFLPLLGTNTGSNTENTNYCSVVWSVDKDHAKKILQLDDGAFAAALGIAFEHRLGQIRHVTPRFSFPLIQRHCKKYFKPGVVVAGDAAHTIHPLAGQGVNLGLQDVAALADEIQRAILRQIPLSDTSILERYQRRRKGSNLAMMGVMEAFKQLFSQDQLPLRWLRNEGMKQLNKTHLIKTKIAREAMGL